MNVSYVNPFITAMINVFKTMINVDIKPDKPKLKTVPHPTFDVSGIIGLSGNAQGNIAISFPKIMALKVVSKMLGMEIKVVGPELTDGIGELANIVAGNAKQDLAQYALSISLPNVVIGKDHILASQTGVPTILVPFHSPMGDFAMEVSLKTKE
jgi:chemotaxis protein CheX